MVCAGEEVCGQILLCVGRFELVGPGDSRGEVGSGAGGVELGVVGGVFVCWIIPVVPAFGAQICGQVGVDVDDAGVGSPRTAEAYGVVGGSGAFCAGGCGVHGLGVVVDGAGDVTVDDDVAGGLVRRGAGLRSDEAG